MTELYSSFLSIRRLGVPVVGALHGHCVGGGAGIALGCCDVRVADRGTLLRFNFGESSCSTQDPERERAEREREREREGGREGERE